MSKIKPKARGYSLAKRVSEEDDEDEYFDGDDEHEYSSSGPAPRDSKTVVAAICRHRVTGQDKSKLDHYHQKEYSKETWELSYSKKEILAADDQDIIWVDDAELLAAELRQRHSDDRCDYIIADRSMNQVRVAAIPVWRGSLNVKEVEKYLKARKSDLYVPVQPTDSGRDTKWADFLKKFFESPTGDLYESKYSREHGYYLLSYSQDAGKRRREVQARQAENQKLQEKYLAQQKRWAAKRSLPIKTTEFSKFGKALYAALKAELSGETRKQFLDQLIKSNSWDHLSKASISNRILFIASILDLLKNPHRDKPLKTLKKSLAYFLSHKEALLGKVDPFPKLAKFVASEAKALKIS